MKLSFKAFVLHLGKGFASFIKKRGHQGKLVFTRESNNPYVCNHGGLCNGKLCAKTFKEALELSGIPEGVSGPNCDNVVDCNDPTFGDI